MATLVPFILRQHGRGRGKTRLRKGENTVVVGGNYGRGRGKFHARNAHSTHWCTRASRYLRSISFCFMLDMSVALSQVVCLWMAGAVPARRKQAERGNGTGRPWSAFRLHNIIVLHYSLHPYGRPSPVSRRRLTREGGRDETVQAHSL